jgi:protein-S-isoprenylcysteine O-methyltransferase Ste14
MLDKVVAFIAKHGGKERSTIFRIVSFAWAFLFFFVIAPIALAMAGHLVAEYISVHVPRTIEISLGVIAISVGLFFILWSVFTFWFIGRGTPVPIASPIRLVTGGPFKYTRNPIKLGAVLFYFGIGTVGDQLVTGFIMFAIGLLLGVMYHKSVEQKELTIRFGKEYEEYRKRTSFLIPLPPRKNKAAQQRAEADRDKG